MLVNQQTEQGGAGGGGGGDGGAFVGADGIASLSLTDAFDYALGGTGDEQDFFSSSSSSSYAGAQGSPVAVPRVNLWNTLLELCLRKDLALAEFGPHEAGAMAERRREVMSILTDPDATRESDYANVSGSGVGVGGGGGGGGAVGGSAAPGPGAASSITGGVGDLILDGTFSFDIASLGGGGGGGGKGAGASGAELRLDLNHALMLMQVHNFKEGKLFLFRKLRVRFFGGYCNPCSL